MRQNLLMFWKANLLQKRKDLLIPFGLTNTRILSKGACLPDVTLN